MEIKSKYVFSRKGRQEIPKNVIWPPQSPDCALIVLRDHLDRGSAPGENNPYIRYEIRELLQNMWKEIKKM